MKSFLTDVLLGGRGLSAAVTPLIASALRSVLVGLRCGARFGIAAAGRAGAVVVRLGLRRLRRLRPLGRLRGLRGAVAAGVVVRGPGGARARVVLAPGPLVARTGRGGVAVARLVVAGAGGPARAGPGVVALGAPRAVLGSARRSWP